MYRPPDLSLPRFLADFETIAANLIPSYSNVLIMGDFNCNLLNDVLSEDFCPVVDSLSLEILETSATFHHPLRSSTRLDLILTSSADKIRTHGNMGAPGFSHHDLLYVAYDLRSPKAMSKVITYRDYRCLDLGKLHEDVSDIDWNLLYNMQSVNDKVEELGLIIQTLFELHVPVKQCRVKRPPAPWLTEEVKSLMEARDRAHARFRRTRVNFDWDRYRRLRNKCVRLCRDARRAHVVHNIKDKTPAAAWSFLNDMGIGGNQEKPQDFVTSLDELNTHFTKCPVQIDPVVKARTLRQISSIPRPDVPAFKFKEVTYLQ